ncbi:phosphotransferase enzyme family protein [Streptomyces sp. YIM 98790]|uniref:phosphotransferase enzyme family protein n=1 Tax=Streptomyces sp. YIM 98790 TaxID=2689077 RepID=UPI00140B7EC2|nr:aminoglycoside phosphotransferase family protein [Streptomyces sp. YIM 98790]
MTGPHDETLAILTTACAAVGLDPAGAEPIRLAENAIWRLPGGIVARITKAGQHQQTERELRLARWLSSQGLPVVRPLPDIDTPATATGRPVTFWDELPPHTRGTVLDVAALIRQLHNLPLPDFPVGRLDPFVRIRDRIDAAVTLADADRDWLRNRLAELQSAWASLPDGLPECLVHGDAWTGNVARPLIGGPALLMDLERCSVGRPEWDLVSTAAKLTTTGAISKAEYKEFCTIYGHDVLAWPGYDTMRATRELRMTTYAAQHAATNPAWRPEAQHRLDCLRGRNGPRPWKWTGIT